MKRNGITLISFVVTIIILIILAGVSINFMFGNEGIFTKTQTAVEKYQNAQIEENMILGKYEEKIDSVRSGFYLSEEQYYNMITRLNNIESKEYGDFRKKNSQAPSTGDVITIENIYNGNLTLNDNKVYLTEGKTYKISCDFLINTASSTHIWYAIYNKNDSQISNNALSINNSFGGYDSCSASTIYTALPNDYIYVKTTGVPNGGTIETGSFYLTVIEI